MTVIVDDCRSSDPSRIDAEVQGYIQGQMQQPCGSTLLADLCSRSDTLISPRVSPLMWTMPQLTETHPDDTDRPYFFGTWIILPIVPQK